MGLAFKRKAAMVLLLIILPATRPASAQVTPTYTLVLASGFLCDSTAASSCVATAKAQRGDSYEFSGAGTLDPANKSVAAAGTFTHKSTSGHVLQTGVWVARELVSFDSYGAAPKALLRESNAFGPARFDPKQKKIRLLSAPVPTGGLAVFHVQLLSTSGASVGAMLQVNCALGEVPADHSSEGIQLSIDRNGGEFSQPVSGRVIFLALPRTRLHSVDTPERPLPSPPESPRN